MRCKHENAARLHGECTYDAHGFIVYEVEFRECFDCGAWLPLGPARDTPETAVEVRAAEIAGLVDSLALASAWLGGNVSDCERDGFEIRDNEEPSCPAEESGYLARCIATHEDPQ